MSGTIYQTTPLWEPQVSNSVLSISILLQAVGPRASHLLNFWIVSSTWLTPFHTYVVWPQECAGFEVDWGASTLKLADIDSNDQWARTARWGSLGMLACLLWGNSEGQVSAFSAWFVEAIFRDLLPHSLYWWTWLQFSIKCSFLRLLSDQILYFLWIYNKCKCVFSVGQNVCNPLVILTLRLWEKQSWPKSSVSGPPMT
jgi:hypothetical protein